MLILLMRMYDIAPSYWKQQVGDLSFFYNRIEKKIRSWSENLTLFFSSNPLRITKKEKEGDSCLKQRKKAFLIPFIGREGDGVFNA